VILIRGLCRSLVELDTVTGGRGPDPPLQAALGRMLVELAEAVRAFGEHVAASVPGPPANQAPLFRALARARAARDQLAKEMAAGPGEAPREPDPPLLGPPVGERSRRGRGVRSVVHSPPLPWV